MIKKIKELIRKKPATVSATVSLVLTNLITLGVLNLSADKAAAIVSLVTLGAMIAANLIAPTKPKTAIKFEEINHGGSE